MTKNSQAKTELTKARTARIKAFMAEPDNMAYYNQERAKSAKEVFIKRLKETRIKARLTQKALAKILGVEQPEISRIENSSNTVTIDTLIAYITALNGKFEVIY